MPCHSALVYCTRSFACCIDSHRTQTDRRAWNAEGSKVNITDLNSTNGTYLGSEELTPMRAQEVSLGTEITFGMQLGLSLDCCIG